MSKNFGQQGFTLVEMLVSMTLTLIVFGLVLGVLDLFQQDNRYDQIRNEQQDGARRMVDRLSRDLRNVASPTAGSPGSLERVTSYDLVFETVSSGAAPAGNPANQMRVRYCLDSSQSLWRQTETWSSSSAPPVPSSTTCPDNSGAWSTSFVELPNVTNTIGADNRPVFNYGPSGWTDPSQVRLVEVNLFIDQNPGGRPGTTQLTSGIYLRNALSPPVASFTITQQNEDVQLDASSSSDPNGQALSYQWYRSGGCPSPSSPISGATTQQYDAGTQPKGAVQTYSLVVTNTGGLSKCASQTVTIT